MSYKNSFIFMLLLTIGIMVSIFAQNYFAWDFANYHHYNAFAFLNNRLNFDIVPSSVNTFFNPLIELPLWFYIKYFNETPTIIFALQGIWFGLFLCVFYLICEHILNKQAQ